MKREIITNLEVQEFLKDFEISSEISILEEGKEKLELEKIAEARGMKIRGSRDLAVFKTIYAFTDKANSNGVILPKKELLRVLPQIIGKPININHNRRFVVGHYIDYKYVQKDNKAIAYGVFYKNHFTDEWTHAKELFKQKKLSSSFEIWSPDEKREDIGGGKYRLHDMEISGGALIYEDKNNVPAFKGAKVLEMAKEKVPELVYASKYKESEIITSTGDYFKEAVKENLKKLQEEKKQKLEKEIEEKKEVKVETKKEEVNIEEKETPKVEEKKVEPTISKIKCSNCEHEWEVGSQVEYKMGSEKCPKCFAIIDQTGKMIYPPQIIDFNVSCPSCQIHNWLIMEKEDHALKVKCLACAHEYKVSFETETVKINNTFKELKFMYSGNVSCYQCGTSIHFTNPSNVKIKNLTCKKCKLSFTFNIEESKRYKNINKIEEIIKEKIEKSSEKGGNKTMELKPDVEKEKAIVSKGSGESKEVAKEEVKVETKITDNTTELKDNVTTLNDSSTVKEDVEKAEEQPKTDETPKAKVEETKAEETPKVEKALKTEEKNVSELAKEASEEACIEKVEPVVIEKQGNELVEQMKDKPETRFEYILEEAEEIKVEAKELDNSAKMTTEQRKALPDNLFAVVVKVKNKKTGKLRKIRMFPINDKAHVRNALARLGQPAPQATLKRLGVSIEKVKAKILKRARQLKMNQLLKKYKSALKKIGEKYLELKKSSKEQIEFYKVNAKKIHDRREELGDEYAKDLTDTDIINDDKFNIAKTEKENLLLKAKLETASEEDVIVGIKPKNKDDSYYSETRKEIDIKAFPKK